MRYISVWEDGSKDDLNNIFTQNFARLPRFYKIMLFFQLGRARDTLRFFKTLLKNFDFKIEVQNLILTFVILGYILHVTGCFWFSSSEGDISQFTNWVNANDL